MKFVFVSVCVFLASCGSAKRITIDEQQTDVNFSVYIPGEWVRLCVIEPYTDNVRASKLLGTEIDLESMSRIGEDNSFVLQLPILANGDVSAYLEVGRGNVDLIELTDRCYPKEKTSFTLINDRHGRALANEIN